MVFEKAIFKFALSRLREAPYEFIAASTLPGLEGVFAVFVLGNAVMLCIIMFVKGFSSTFSALRMFRIAALVCTWAVLRRRNTSVQFRHGFALVCVCLLVVTAPFSTDGLDYIVRHRSMAMQAVFWRAMLPFGAVRIRYCGIVVPILTAIEIIATWRSMRMCDESGIQRISLVLILSSILSMFWCSAVARAWYILHRNQQQIALEQEASQSLLSMICDATFWLAPDGETLVHSNPQLESLLGTSGIKGTPFSLYLAGNEYERFQSVLRSGSKHVLLLPTTLQKADSGQVGVDLFVVDRRLNVRDDAWRESASCHYEEWGSASGLLIGVRVNAETEHLLEATTVESGVAPTVLPKRTASCSSKSDTSVWSLDRIPHVESIKIDFDALNSGTPITSIAFEFASSERNFTMEQSMSQPSWDIFNGWVQDHYNHALCGETSTQTPLGAMLIRLPQHFPGNKNIFLSASEAYLDQFDVECLDDDEYPLCTLVLKGLHSVVKGHCRKDPLPAVSEVRRRSCPRTQVDVGKDMEHEPFDS